MYKRIAIAALCALCGAVVVAVLISAAAMAVSGLDIPAAPASAPIDNPQEGGYGMELVEQYWGIRYAAVVKGSLVYASVGQRLYVYSIANPASPVLLGKSKLMTNPSQALDVEEGYAFLADPGINPSTTSPGAGMHIVDVSMPVQSQEVYFYPSNKYGYLDIDVFNGVAYIVDAGGNLHIVDVSNPEAPSLIKSLLVISGPLEHVQVAQHPIDGKLYAYVISIGNMFFAIDVSVPGQAAVVGSLTLPVYGMSDLAISGLSALVADGDYGNIHLLDLTNPALPVLVASSTFPDGKSIYQLDWLGDRVYGYQSGITTGLVVMDASGSGMPVETGFYPTESDFSVSGGQVNNLPLALLITASGIDIVSSSNPAAPQILGSILDEGYLDEVQVVGDLVYLSGEQGLRIYRRTAPGQLEYVGGLNQPGNLGLVQDGKAYLTERAIYDWYGRVSPSRFSVVDVSDPSHPQSLDSLDLVSYANDVVVYGANAYLASGNRLEVVDISNPAQITMTGVYTSPIYIDYPNYYSLAVAPNPDDSSQLLAYLADFGQGLAILDVTQPLSVTPVLTLTSTLRGARALEFIDLPGETGKFLAMAGDGYLKLLDVTHPMSTTILVSEYIDCDPYDLTTRPGRAYVACDLIGGRLYLASLGSLDLRGYYRFPYRVRDLAVTGDFIYITAGGEGLFEIWHGLTNYIYLPITGGLMTSDFYTLTLDFAADTFTESVDISLDPRYYGNMTSTFRTIGADYYFDLAMNASSGMMQPLIPYQVEWQYAPADFPGIDENTLGLYFWDGVRWVREPSSAVDTAANVVSASPQHASLWGLLAERQGVRELYLPMVNR